MKKLTAALGAAFLCAISVVAQTPTPNLQMALPNYGALNWNVTLNSDLTTIDTAIGNLQGAFQGVWSSTSVYSKGMTVTYANQLFVSRVNSNFNNTPSSGSTAWSLMTSAGTLPGGSSQACQSNNGTGGLAGDNTACVINTTTHQTGLYDPATKLPRVDPTHPSFAAAGTCSNAADPTGHLDSTCAIQAAVNYAASNPVSAAINAYPEVYLPGGGNYKISSAIRLPCQLAVTSDGINPAVVSVNSATTNAFTIYTRGSTLAPVAAGSCQGALTNLSITVQSAYVDTNRNPMIELDGATGYRFTNVSCQNALGRCKQINNAERLQVNNDYTSYVGRADVIIGASNESKIDNIRSANPGAVLDGTCDGPNCGGVNGPHYFPGTQTGMVLGSASSISLTGASVNSSGLATFTFRCNVIASCPSGNAYTSPIAAGHWFRIQGIADLTALNGTWQATSVTNNSPAGNFSVTAMLTSGQPTYGPDQTVMLLNPTTYTTAGTSSGFSSATFQIVIAPNPISDIYVSGSTSLQVSNASLKATQYVGGYQNTDPNASSFDYSYIERFGTNGQPGVNGYATIGGYIPYTNLSAALASSTTCTTSAPCAVGVVWPWAMPNFFGDPTQLNDLLEASLNMVIAPQDYNPSICTASAYVPGVERCQYEAVDGSFSSDSNLHLIQRAAFSNSFTVSGISWPAGSHVGFTENMGSLSPWNTDGAITLSHEHFGGSNPGSNYYAWCDDEGPFVCAGADMYGAIPDYVMNWPVGTTNQAVQGPTVIVHDGAVGNCNLSDGFGIEPSCIKISGGANVQVDSTNGNFISTTAIGSQTALAGVVQSQAPYGFKAIQYITQATGQSTVTYRDLATGFNLTMPTTNSTAGAHIIADLPVTDTSSAFGANPGYSFNLYGKWFTTSYCWDDAPPTGGHAQNRWCFEGQPGMSGGFEWDTWSGSAWVNAFTLTPSAITGTLGSLVPLTNASNSFTVPQSFSGALAGLNTNLVTYSWAPGTTGTNGWTDSGTGFTATPNAAADPYGKVDAMQLVTTTLGGYNGPTNNNGMSLTSGQEYAVGFWYKGTTGSELIRAQVGNAIASPGVAGTSAWKWYCGTVTPTGNLATTIQIETQTSSATIDFWGFSLVPGTVCASPFPTQSSPVVSGAPTVAAVNGNFTALTEANNPVPAATTSTPSGTCTPNGYIPIVIGTTTVHMATCD